MAEFLLHIWERFYLQIWQYTEAALILGVLEYLLPIEKAHTLRGRLFAWYLSVVGYFLSSLVIYPASLLAAKINPVFSVDLMTLVSKQNIFYVPYVYLMVPLVPAFVNDFFFYVWHRLQHKVPFLWRFHSLHHSVESLNASSPLQHWTEGIVQYFTISIPAVALFHFNLQSLGYLYLYLRLWNGIIHCNIRIQHPFFNWVLGGPQFHRIHHSVEPKHYDKNFAFFPVWDFIFGTHYNPAKGEFPKTGIPGRRQSRTLKNFLLWGITSNGDESEERQAFSSFANSFAESKPQP